MADVYTRIGYIKGATGATGAQGEKGDTGDAATIQVGSVTTVPYGQTANVVNSGTEQAAVFDFTIPQGRPGQQVTEMDNLLLNSITTSAAEFPLPAVGETGKVLWGKVVKWFSDMTALVATKLNTSNVVNNLTTTSSGYALDARQGKALKDEIVEVKGYSDWKSLGYTGGDNTLAIAFPSDYHEIYVMTVLKNGTVNICQTFIRGNISGTERAYQSGYASGNLSCLVSWGVKDNQVRVIEAWADGINVTSTAMSYWAYR